MDENITMRLDRDHTSGYLGNGLAKWELGFKESPNKSENHTIIEVEMNITLNSLYKGKAYPDELNYTLPLGNINKTIRIMFSAAEYLCGWEIPTNVSLIDATTYAEFRLSFKPPQETISFGSYLLIITVILGSVAILISKELLKEIKK